MSRIWIVVSILLALMSFGGVRAYSVRAQFMNPPELLIYNVWVRPTAPEPAEGTALSETPEAPVPGTVSGAYMTIENISDRDYQLVGIDANFAEMSMLHQTSIDDKGVARMQMVSRLDIPAGETVTLAPAGYHAMLMNILSNIYPGQAVALTLTFEDSDGATFDMTVGALATDFPPEDDTLIVANAVAQPDPHDSQSLDIGLTVDNRGNQNDTLTGATSDLGGTAMMRYLPGPRIFPYTSLDVPAQHQTVFTPDGVFIRLIANTELSQNAFPITLEFASGKTLTVAVPITGEAS